SHPKLHLRHPVRHPDRYLLVAFHRLADSSMAWRQARLEPGQNRARSRAEPDGGTLTDTMFSAAPLLTGRPPISGYGPGLFRLGGIEHRGSLLILPDGVYSWQVSD